MNFKSNAQRKAVMANLNKKDIANLYKKPKATTKNEFNKKTMLTEAEISLILKRLNNNRMDLLPNFKTYKEDNEDGWKLTPEQTKKGLNWLKTKGKKYLYEREQGIVDNFKEFRLVEFHSVGNQYRTQYVPLYRVYSKRDGAVDSSFEYYYFGGEMHIVG